jgi:3-dehydroquinate synthase
MLRFVILDDIAVPARLENPPEDLLQRAYEKVSR